MKVFRARINDYGYGDCTYVLVAANDLDEAINYILEVQKDRLDLDDIWECTNLQTNVTEIGYIEQF
jgi:hypothetical protein